MSTTVSTTVSAMSGAGRDYDGTIVSIDRRTSVVSQLIAKKSLLWARNSLEKLPIKLTLGNIGFLAVVMAVVMPRAFTHILVYPIFRLVFGTLYPAYASYKAVRTKNVKEYVKWMMYWIVFALFTCAETFTDVFFSFWFPFYYEIKIILVLWLLSPATKGSSILYRRFVHPALSRREAEIDEALARATEQGYTAVLHLGTRGVNYATTVLMQTAIKNFPNVVPTNPQNAFPASQSDSAISSLANPTTKPTTKESSMTDSPDGAGSRRRTRSEDDGSSIRPDIDFDSSSPLSTRIIRERPNVRDDSFIDELLGYSLKEDNMPTYDEDEEDGEEAEEAMEQDKQPEFKAPKRKPRKTVKKERPRPTARKATLRSFDAEFSDETDLM